MGKFLHADGNIYSGQWKEGKMHGKGMFMSKGGKKTYGEWHLGHLVKLTADEEREPIKFSETAVFR